jgi:hypothetical protein
MMLELQRYPVPVLYLPKSEYTSIFRLKKNRTAVPKINFFV